MGGFRRPPPSVAAPSVAAETGEKDLDESSKSSKVFEGEIQTFPRDLRQYRAVTLPNGLQALLVSDPSADRAAGALAVRVGYFSDPEDLPGLAHFCEHMLFLGTKKYPDESSFEGFLAKNGGSSNAFTDKEQTCYFFDVSPTAFAEATDRFSQFFVAPLFTPSAVGREVNAIDSEHAKNLQSDGWRLQEIQKLRVNPDHPLKKFGTGNLQTLRDEPKKKGLNPRDALLDFHQQYYVSDHMALCLSSPSSLDEMQTLVERSFNQIRSASEDSQVPFPEEKWAGKVNVFDPDTRPMRVDILPVKDARQVTLNWAFECGADPLLQRRLELLKGWDYIGHLLGHEGEGSLLSYLKKNGLATAIVAGEEDDAKDFQVFSLSVSLTPLGLQEVEAVVETVFAYVNMLKKQKIPLYVYDECQRLSELGWSFTEKGEPQDLAVSVATKIHDLREKPELWLSAGRRLFRDSEGTPRDSVAPAKQKTEIGSEVVELTEQLIQALNPASMMMIVASKDFASDPSFLDQKEPIYGTRYRTSLLANDFVSSLNKATLPKELSFPKPNDLIPSDLSIRLPAQTLQEKEEQRRKRGTIGRFANIPLNGNGDGIGDTRQPMGATLQAARSPLPSVPVETEDDLKPFPAPILIKDDAAVRVHHRQDDRWLVPKASVYLQLFKPLPEGRDIAERTALARMLSLALRDHLTEFSYEGTLAGLGFDFNADIMGASMSLGGFTDKLKKFAEGVGDAVGSMESWLLEESRSGAEEGNPKFERWRDVLRREFSAFDTLPPYAHAKYWAGQAYYTERPDIASVRAALEKITPESLLAFAKTLPDDSACEALVEGNVPKDEALSLVETLRRRLKLKRPKSIDSLDPRPQQRIFELPKVKAEATKGKIAATSIRRLSFNPEETNSASRLTLQIASRDEKDVLSAQLIGDIVSTPFYDELRTKQQLGYIVQAAAATPTGIPELYFIAQSKTGVSDAEGLAERTEEFLKQFGARLKKMQEKDVKVYIDALRQKKLEKPKDLTEEASRDFTEILTGTYDFDRKARQAQTLLSMRKADLVAFWDRFISPGAPERRALAVLVEAHTPQTDGRAKKLEQQLMTASTGETEKGTAGLPLPVEHLSKGAIDLTGDLEDFKKSLPLLPPWPKGKPRLSDGSSESAFSSVLASLTGDGAAKRAGGATATADVEDIRDLRELTS